jgi:drug/metabolite transporter (DMT)-like permease
MMNILDRQFDNDNKDAIVFASLHALAFALSTVVIKWLSASFPVLEQVFSRSIVGLIFLVPHMWRLRSELVSKSWPLLLFRGIAGFIGIVCLFFTVSKLPLIIAMILTLITPVFVMMFGSLFLGERVSARQLGYAVVILFAVTMVVYPKSAAISAISETDVSAYLIYVAVGIIGSVSTAAAFVSVKASLKAVSVNVVVFYFLSCNIVLSLLFGARDFVVPNMLDFFVLLSLGVIGLFSDIFKTRAYKKAISGIVSVVSLMSIVFSALFGLIFFNEMMSMRQGLGVVLLVLGIFMLSRPDPVSVPVRQ